MFNNFAVVMKIKKLKPLNIFFKGEIAQVIWKYLSITTGFDPQLNFKKNVRKWWSFMRTLKLKWCIR